MAKRPPDTRLLCRNGHRVEKLKKLKAWQGFLRGRECSICNAGLDREEDRWTCTERCNWSVCRKCYDTHWSRVIRKAAQTADDNLREVLLSTVPEACRQSTDYLVAKQGKRAQPVPNSSWPQLMSPAHSGDGSVRSASAEGSPSAAQYTRERWYKFNKLDDEGVQVALWLSAGSAAAGLVFWSSSLLLRSEDLGFPHPFLLVGLSQLGAMLLCRLAACILGRFAPPAASPAVVRANPPGVAPQGMSSEAEWKAAGILGLMYGVDHCIGASVLYHLSLASRGAAYALTPAAMLGAGVLSGTDLPEKRCLQAVAGVTLGGLLMVSSGFDDWDVLQMGLLAILADAVKMFRWIFTRNVLPQESGVPLLVFAARMIVTTAALGFELTFVFDFYGYPGLLSLPKPGKVAALVLAAAFGIAVKLTSELHLAQLTSVTVLGFFSPVCNVGLLLWADAFGGDGASVVRVLGAALCLGGMGAYAYLRQRGEEADHTILIAPPQPSYVRLPADGQGPPLQSQRLPAPLPPAAAAAAAQASRGQGGRRGGPVLSADSRSRRDRRTSPRPPPSRSLQHVL